MVLPTALASCLEADLGRITETVPVSGGDISQAARVRLAGGAQILVKWRSGSPPGLFTAERRGLELLRAAGVLRTPEVLAQAEATATCPAFIALEWLDLGTKSSQSTEALGRGLAAQHHVLASSFGLDRANFIGANPQPNHRADNWVGFFREQRLGFQMKLAGRNGFLPAQRAHRL
jgi:fructosamine-3-kinase